MPYPPAYTEIYPAVPVVSEAVNPHNMGWQAPQVEVVMPQQPTVSYGTVVTQQPGRINFEVVEKGLKMWKFSVPSVLHNQSRIGLYPMKLQPCPHCQKEGKTTVKQDAVNFFKSHKIPQSFTQLHSQTIRTHLLALILCVSW